MPWSSSSIAEVGDDDQHVAGDPVLDRAGRRPGSPRRRAFVRSISAPGLRPAGRARVLEAVVVALVAVDGRGRRVELEDRLPEPVGELRRPARSSGSDGVTGVLQGWAEGRDVGRSGYRRRRGSAVGRGPVGAASARRTAASCSPHRSTSGSSPRYGSRSSRLELVAVEERPEVVPLQDVPVVALERLAEERRPLELVADELGPLRGDDEEPDDRLLLRDPGVAAEERLAEHRGPLDLEQERDAGRGRTRRSRPRRRRRRPG